ncbi:unnamed protein product [Darwinula stevensoni]|uniref:Dynamin-like GTPase OPA1, mitochondrial n=1 Tax=Darwinula stevensoni TaxID=69355 RepID=A0A7R9A4M9_9CRUS|nr:unnamed protein product [Darwinula stevensoni]CAG0883716.1 unnamed protein product [Darwinula stevensoni]
MSALARSHHLLRHRRLVGVVVSGQPNRSVAMVVARILRGALKIRYLILGGAVGGGYQLQKTYDKWRESVPDMSWMKELMPSTETVDSFRASLSNMGQKFKGTISSLDVDPKWREFGDEKYSQLKKWFDQRLEDAIEAAKEADEVRASAEMEYETDVFSVKAAHKEEQRDPTRERLESLEAELMAVQLKYQRELEKVEKENRELRRQLLLRGKEASSKKHIKKSLIDMYSEVLDELSGYDSNYNVQDHLPRVVVVGDQSSGKTSVLEMIAGARIFPRGAGEMMTRAPVQVTLSEGPYHIAQFKDSSREYDLAKESDLAALCQDVEYRMRNSVRPGKTISNEVISMTVKGPGLQRMVLVDLPGIISTVTTEMASDTRENIRQISQAYMANPNAIILCIQDGSIDAERSNVTDLVSQMDPQGKRTIFVLTKVDMAEENLASPDRIKKALSGLLFPMRALGYFAVVTGKGNRNDTIEEIRSHEEKFFKSSQLFRHGLVNSTQLTTRNLSFAVSECFWKMVQDTVEQQADAFKATRFNLETEWKNKYPRLRELDRDELFDKGRGEILDDVVALGQVSPKQWEDALKERLWSHLATYVFDQIYLPAAQTHESGTFNTTVDIKLKQWADGQLPRKCVELGWQTLQDVFWGLLSKSLEARDHDTIFDQLKKSVVQESFQRHQWEDKAKDILRVIQLNALEDRSIKDKSDWDAAIKFLDGSIQQNLQVVVETTVNDMVGPGIMDQWLKWQSPSPEQKLRSAIGKELEKLLNTDAHHSPHLSYEEVSMVRKNLATSQSLEVDNDLVRQTWVPVFRKHFLGLSLKNVGDCRRSFYQYQHGLESEVDCNAVVLFWRIQQMLQVTANSLRQQIMNREARRLEREVKSVLEDFSQDCDKKKELLTGRRVQLAEELKRVREIQERLEEFINALSSEK